MTQGALKPPASSDTASASSDTARCFERHSKKAGRRFGHCFHLPHTSVLAGRVVDLILESLRSQLLGVYMVGHAQATSAQHSNKLQLLNESHILESAR